MLKYRTKHDSYGNDKVYESLKKLLSRTNKKKLVLSRFLQNFYNDITSNVQELLFIPYSLFEESYIEKRDFIDAFNQTFQIIWEDVRDNPKLLEFMSRIFLDFTKNKICGYEDLEHNEELMKGNEEFVEIFEEFMKTSSNLITNQVNFHLNIKFLIFSPFRKLQRKSRNLSKRRLPNWWRKIKIFKYFDVFFYFFYLAYLLRYTSLTSYLYLFKK